MQKKTHSIPANRKKKLPAYKSFRLSRTIKPDNIRKTATMKELWRETWAFLWQHRKKMLLFVLLYTISYLVLVKGFSNFTLDTVGIKDELKSALDGNIGSLLTFLSLYVSLFSSLTTTTDNISNYFQLTVLVIFSLAFIWLVRRLHVRNATPTVKESFYVGMRPLIPFLLVLTVLALELVPAGLGTLIYSATQSASIIATDGELLGISVVAILGIVLSVYLVSGSIFALYIVTLPKMTPIVSLRSSMLLLRIHRWQVLRRLLGFFALLVVIGFIIVLPFIIWLPNFAEIAFFVIGCASFAISHTYVYKLYRSML